LTEILETEFESDLDLVIDDGSHLAEQTETTFATLFPRIREGGFYVIEDWNWELEPQCRAPDHAYAREEGLIGLVTDLLRVTASSTAIRSMTAYRAFVAIEKGPGVEGSRFDLASYLEGLPVKLSAGDDSDASAHD
jgi:hypothetical protein